MKDPIWMARSMDRWGSWMMYPVSSCSWMMCQRHQEVPVPSASADARCAYCNLVITGCSFPWFPRSLQKTQKLKRIHHKNQLVVSSCYKSITSNTPDTHKQMYCSWGDYRLVPDARFCPKCGHPRSRQEVESCFVVGEKTAFAKLLNKSSQAGVYFRSGDDPWWFMVQAFVWPANNEGAKQEGNKIVIS